MSATAHRPSLLDHETAPAQVVAAHTANPKIFLSCLKFPGSLSGVSCRLTDTATDLEPRPEAAMNAV